MNDILAAISDATIDDTNDSNCACYIRRSTRSRSKPIILTMEKGGLWCDKYLAMMQTYRLPNFIVNDVYTQMS